MPDVNFFFLACPLVFLIADELIHDGEIRQKILPGKDFQNFYLQVIFQNLFDLPGEVLKFFDFPGKILINFSLVCPVIF